jgi:hypothetical protein
MTMISILTEEEILKIAQAAILGSGGTLAEDKIIGTVQWAKLVRTQAGLLQDILAGRVLVDVTGAEPIFKEADFARDSKGYEIVAIGEPLDSPVLRA